MKAPRVSVVVTISLAPLELLDARVFSRAVGSGRSGGDADSD